MIVPRPRAIVVGATFGSHYARALADDRSPADLVGLVGTGGEAGRALAEELDIPYLHGIDDVDGIGRIDLAVVAVRSTLVGGQGDDIARQLLARGTAVLQELPIHSSDVVDSMKVARRAGTVFSVTGFYEHLPSVRRFIATARALAAESPILAVELRTSVQVLHSSLLVLSRLIASSPPQDVIVHPAAAPAKMFISSTWGSIAVDISVRNGFDSRMPNANCQPLLGCILTTPDGELSLEHVHGPTRWEPRPHEATPGRLHNPHQPLSSSVGPATCTGETLVSAVWPTGIRSAVQKLVTATAEGRAPIRQRDLSAIRHWETISTRLGRPAELPASTPRSIDVHRLQEGR